LGKGDRSWGKRRVRKRSEGGMGHRGSKRGKVDEEGTKGNGARKVGKSIVEDLLLL